MKGTHMPYKDPAKNKACEKKWRQANKDKVVAHTAKWKKANPEAVKYQQLKNRYGITKEEHLELISKQNNCCKICQEPKKLYVDHCHETKQVRGLLCHNCNTALGHLKDSPELLNKAAEYLKSTSA
jgi:hypothetical protein